MYTFPRRRILLLASAPLLFSCRDSSNPVVPATRDAKSLDPHFTMGSGTTPTALGRATFSGNRHRDLRVKRRTGNWRIEIEAKPAVDIAVQTIKFEPGGQSGWHRHPGPVFIQVKSGVMTFYESDDPKCTPIVRKAGEGYLDAGEHAHIARNEGSLPAENVVTYFVPPGADLKIDADKPGNCPF